MSAFTSCKTFCATMVRDRENLGEKVTAWLNNARAERPGFQIVDVVVRQSSDEGFHCITIAVFFNETPAKENKRRG